MGGHPTTEINGLLTSLHSGKHEHHCNKDSYCSLLISKRQTFKRKGQSRNSPFVSQSNSYTLSELRQNYISLKCGFNPKLTVFMVLQARNDL
jgi:hypothetical protein